METEAAWLIGPYQNNGITIGVGLSALFLLPLFSSLGVVIESMAQKRYAQQSRARLVGVLLACAVLLYASIVLHEFSHAVMSILTGAGFTSLTVTGGFVNQFVTAQQVGPIASLLYQSAGIVSQLVLGMYLISRQQRSVKCAGWVIITFCLTWQLISPIGNDRELMVQSLRLTGLIQ